MEFGRINRRRWILYVLLSVCDGILTWYSGGIALAMGWLSHAVQEGNWVAVGRLAFPPASFFEFFVAGAVCAPALIYFLEHMRGKKASLFAIISVLAGVVFAILVSGACSAFLGTWEGISEIYASPENTLLEKAHLFFGLLMFMAISAYTQVIFVSCPGVILIGGSIGGLFNGFLVRKTLSQTAEYEDYGWITPVLRLISLFILLASFVALAMLVDFMMTPSGQLANWNIFKLWTLLGSLLVLIGGLFAGVQLWKLKPSGRMVTILILLNAVIYYAFSAYRGGIHAAAPVVLSCTLLLVVASRSAKEACSSRANNVQR